MSHFTVLVIGDDVDEQLAPYSEHSEVAPYRSYWDERQFAFWQRALLDEDPTVDVSSPEQLVAVYNARHYPDGPEEGAEEDYLQIEGSSDGVIETAKEQFVNGAIGVELMEKRVSEALSHARIYTISTYNPRSKWDWYQTGGRWRGYFKLKPGIAAHPELLGDAGVFDNPARHDADMLLRGHVDVEGMRDLAGESAGSLWDRVHEVIGPVNGPFTPWLELLARADDKDDLLNYEEARNLYHDQPQVRAIRLHDDQAHKEGRDEDILLGFFGSVDELLVPREEYVQSARDNAICPYAYLKDGIWDEPGQVGWFGSSSETPESRAAFVRRFNEMFDALPDDALLTLVDCHI